MDVLSPGGYATWRLSMLLPMLAIWALLAVSRVDAWRRGVWRLRPAALRLGSRLRVVVAKLAAIATALVLAGALLAVLTLAGALATEVELAPRRAFLFGLNTTLFASSSARSACRLAVHARGVRPLARPASCWRRRSSLASAGGCARRRVAWAAFTAYYFELNKPLVTGYDVNVGGSAADGGLRCRAHGHRPLFFVRRDIGAPYVLLERFLPQRRPPRMLPMQSWSLQSLMTRNARRVAAPASGGASGRHVFAAADRPPATGSAELSDLLADLSRNNPMYAEFIDRFTRGGDIAANMLFLNAVFSLLVVVVAAFAVSLANRWATDEEEGRLDLILATPRPRYLVMLTPFAACAIGLTIATGFIFVGCALASAAVGMELDIERVAGAAFGMVPVGLVVASIGFLLGGWLRVRAMTGILIALVLASFVLTLLAPLFHWPRALLQLSIFERTVRRSSMV